MKSVNLWEMANLTQNDTGLAAIIWVSTKSGVKHGPRIKVKRDYATNFDVGDTFTITISDSPEVIGTHNLTSKDIKQIIKFIKLNKDILLQYWNTEISTRTMLDSIQDVR